MIITISSHNNKWCTTDHRKYFDLWNLLLHSYYRYVLLLLSKRVVWKSVSRSDPSPAKAECYRITFAVAHMAINVFSYLLYSILWSFICWFICFHFLFVVVFLLNECIWMKYFYCLLKIAINWWSWHTNFIRPSIVHFPINIWMNDNMTTNILKQKMNE